MLTQRRWRTIGTITLGASAAMAAIGARYGFFRHCSPTTRLGYWILLLLLLLVSVYIALLDLRYIRMRYAMEKREVFRRTLGEESFRKELRNAQETRTEKRDPGTANRNN